MARHKKIQARVLFKSYHNLEFESRAWVRDPKIQEFRIGTCHGQWFPFHWPLHSAYVILSVINEYPGNGHFEDVLQWFEQSAKRDKYALEIWEIHNWRLFDHLIRKRGFKEMIKKKNDSTKHVIKFP